MTPPLLRPRRARLLGACLLVAGLCAPAGYAQAPAPTRGLFLKAHVNGVRMSFGDDAARQQGAGAGVQVGYGLAPRVALFAGFDGSYADSDGLADGYLLAQGGLGLLLHFPSDATVAAVPYLVVGYDVRRARFETRLGDVATTGGAITAGGGVAYFFRPRVALDASVAASFGTFSNVAFEGVTLPGVVDVDASSLRLQLGLTWFIPGTG